MEVIFGLALMVFGLWLLWEIPGIIIPIIIVVVVFKSCSSSVEVSVEESVDPVETEQVVEQPPEPLIENSVTEKCIDGIVYLLIIENGENFTGNKKDTFGYNLKCSN